MRLWLSAFIPLHVAQVFLFQGFEPVEVILIEESNQSTLWLREASFYELSLIHGTEVVKGESVHFLQLGKSSFLQVFQEIDEVLLLAADGGWALDLIKIPDLFEVEQVLQRSELIEADGSCRLDAPLITVLLILELLVTEKLPLFQLLSVHVGSPLVDTFIAMLHESEIGALGKACLAPQPVDVVGDVQSFE